MIQTRCFYGHHSPQLITVPEATLVAQDPDFAAARRSAEQSKLDFTAGLSGRNVGSTSEVKSRLSTGIPLALIIDFYFGSWNHRGGAKLGIESDAGLYDKGIVTFPEPGSMDRKFSPQERERHSIEIVGYDDNVVVTYTKKMTDGTTQTFTRKGVYYFKNSWSLKFGRNFTVDRKRIPGFGMILQDYANMGQFYAVDLAQATTL